MSLFKKSKDGAKPVSQILVQQEDPVNYNSVLDYLVGLSKREYDKIIKVSVIYREANVAAAKVLGVKDEPTTTLKDESPADEAIEEALDEALEAEGGLIIDEDAPLEPEKPKKPHASDKKVKS